MNEAKTILQWTYEPKNFFEVPVIYSNSQYELTLQDGNANAELSTSQDPVPDALLKEIETKVNSFLKARMILEHQNYKVGDVRIRQEKPDGSIRTLVNVKDSLILTSKIRDPDLTIIDDNGNIISNTRAERIAEQKAFMELIAASADKHPLLSKMISSYESAVSDPQNELVHLYEIRDALYKHYCSKKNANSQLGYPEAKLNRLGILCNDMPIEQARHRGKHTTNLRPATEVELEEARKISRELIQAFAEKIV